jgi:hypothetical protein
LAADVGGNIVVQLSREDAEFYFDDRKDKKFNCVAAGLIEPHFATNAPANFYGDVPFTGETFTTPNEDYFAHADLIVSMAAERGIVMMLTPLWLGFNCGDEGWCEQVQAASLSDMRQWGRYIGNRYKDYGNIIWQIGGDTDPAPVKNKVREFVAGIRDFDRADRIYTAHNQPESYAVTPWENDGWLNLNNVYSYAGPLYQRCRTAYEHSPVLPYFLAESMFENEGATNQRLRAQAYWPVLSGATGYLFGNCPIFHFGAFPQWCNRSNWKAELDGSGSIGMMYAKRLFDSRAWHNLVPDFNHTVLTAGFGTWGQTDYATAALTSDGTTMMAYLPSRRTVTVDMSRISGTEAVAWWFDPADGVNELIGSFPTTGSRQFTPPSLGDWVLVVDDAALAAPAPGDETF